MTKAVTAVETGNGWAAWRELSHQCEPEVATRQAHAMNQFTGMVSKRARTIIETKQLVNEMDRRAKAWQELKTDGRISEEHLKSVLASVIDTQTQMHTLSVSTNSYAEFKAAVLDFANAVIGLQPNEAPPLNSFGERSTHEQGNSE